VGRPLPNRGQSRRSGKGGSKLHVAGDAAGLPSSLVVSAANANDSTMPEAVLEDDLGMDDKLTLPAFREEDLEFLDRLDTRSSGPG
jgi:hypothetical protein